MNLSGPLPEVFSKLVNLQFLFTNDNHFTGTLPACWSQIGRLSDAVAMYVIAILLNVYTLPLHTTLM
jgi:hypothetical protein